MPPTNEEEFFDLFFFVFSQEKIILSSSFTHRILFRLLNVLMVSDEFFIGSTSLNRTNIGDASPSHTHHRVELHSLCACLYSRDSLITGTE